MRRILFSLGPVHINSFGFMIALGILAAFFFIHLESRRKGLDEDRVFDFIFWALILGIIGARIGYVVIAGPAFYLQHPLQLLWLQDGGLSIHGAIVGGLLAGVIFCRRYRVPFWRLADVMAPALALGIAIGRVGCDVFGRPMSKPLPWGVLVNGQLLHPAQVYEFLLDYLLCFYLWRKRKRITYDGQLFINFIVLYATIRGIVEFSRFNPHVFGPFTVAHVASLVLILAAVLVSIMLKTDRLPEPTAGGQRSAVPAHGWDIAAKIENNLLLQTGLLLLAMVLSLLIFYGFRP